jgi:hypothetical protein
VAAARSAVTIALKYKAWEGANLQITLAGRKQLAQEVRDIDLMLAAIARVMESA